MTIAAKDIASIIASAAARVRPPDQAAVAAAADSGRWNTRGFFERASVADVMRCLETGATVTTRDEDGATPLHWAAEWSQDASVIEGLLEAGAAVNTRTLNGVAPLHHAAGRRADNPAILKALLDAGAAVGARDKHEFTPSALDGENQRRSRYRGAPAGGRRRSRHTVAGRLHAAALRGAQQR